MALTADSILARSTRRRQTSTGWNTAYIGANRYTLRPDETPPAEDALHPMAFLVEKVPGAVTRPHFHQADQFQVVVAGRGRLGEHEFSDGVVHYTGAYSAYGPIVAGKSGIWWFTLRNRWDPGARYMPAAQPALRRQTSKVGAGCGNAARPVLCGGCPVMGIPTAIILPGCRYGCPARLRRSRARESCCVARRPLRSSRQGRC